MRVHLPCRWSRTEKKIEFISIIHDDNVRKIGTYYKEDYRDIDGSAHLRILARLATMIRRASFD